MSAFDYEHQADRYALREVAGTDFIAFCEVAEQRLLCGFAVLDFGCGAGRSSRFLRGLGNRVTGVDASRAMIAQALTRDPAGDYRLVSRGEPLPFKSGTFDAVFASWALVEEGDERELVRTMSEFARVLRPAGTVVVIANTREFYSGRWLTCDVDFPENAPPLRPGQSVRARLLPEGVDVTDYFWTDEDHARVARAAGFETSRSLRPLGRADDPFPWRDERVVAPYVIHVIVKTKTP